MAVFYGDTLVAGGSNLNGLYQLSTEINNNTNTKATEIISQVTDAKTAADNAKTAADNAKAAVDGIDSKINVIKAKTDTLPSLPICTGAQKISTPSGRLTLPARGYVIIYGSSGAAIGISTTSADPTSFLFQLTVEQSIFSIPVCLPSGTIIKDVGGSRAYTCLLFKV